MKTFICVIMLMAPCFTYAEAPFTDMSDKDVSIVLRILESETLLRYTPNQKVVTMAKSLGHTELTDLRLRMREEAAKRQLPICYMGS